MHLADEVNDQILAVVAGRLKARELEGWLDSVAPEVHAEENPQLRSLTDRAFTLLAEVGYGDRTIDDARHQLDGLLRSGSGTDPSTGEEVVSRLPKHEPIVHP